MGLKSVTSHHTNAKEKVKSNNVYCNFKNIIDFFKANFEDYGTTILIDTHSKSASIKIGTHNFVYDPNTNIMLEDHLLEVAEKLEKKYLIDIEDVNGKIYTLTVKWDKATYTISVENYTFSESAVNDIYKACTFLQEVKIGCSRFSATKIITTVNAIRTINKHKTE